MMTTATLDLQSTATKQGFKQVTGDSGATLFVREKGADHSESMKALDMANLEPFAYQEILPILMKDKALNNSLKGKWFYLAGKGLHKELDLYTVNQEGELIERKRKVPAENSVGVWNGENELSLGVYSDDGVAFYGRRFDLDADDDPAVVAPVVLGKAKQKQEPSEALDGRVAAEPKIAPELLERIEATVAKLNAAEQALKELLRVLS